MDTHNKINFKQRVFDLVRSIPKGYVMTYGQIAVLCGHPGAARVVGQIAHFGSPDLPWHRVVNAKGGMASAFVPGGREMQAKLLNEEGIEINNNSIDIKRYIWWPSN